MAHLRPGCALIPTALMPTKPHRARPTARAPSDSAPRAADSHAAGQLHPRNRHQGRYDFPLLLQHDPRLQPFVLTTPAGEPSIDFANALAVKALNRALLLAHYGIREWDLPPQNLCPPVPGRVDMLHYLADLLARSNGGKLPMANRIRVLDIGTGASCIYPLLGSSEYGWEFVASDLNPASLSHAQTLLAANPHLAARIRLRQQTDAAAIFQGIIQGDDWFDLTLCNPPFHASRAQAQEGTQRKWHNLGKTQGQTRIEGKHPEMAATAAPRLNFGGQDAELWCEGGERAFILRMIRESAHFARHCFWFSTLVSKADNLPAITAALKQARVTSVETTGMSQGQKQSRVVAWTFLNPAQQAAWRARQRG